MSKQVQVKGALVVLLGAAVLIGQRWGGSAPLPYWFTLALVIFGLVNVLISPPGTHLVRAAAIALSVVALLAHNLIGSVVLFLAWLMWPPAFLVALTLGRPADSDGGSGQHEGRAEATRAQIVLAALIGAVALASLAYRLLVAERLQQTSALFVGIPALLAFVVVFAVSPRSAVGVACKAVTIGLLVSLLLLGEGVLCVVMSAPLFYTVAIVIATAVDQARRREKSITTLFSCCIVLALAPMTLEGVTEVTTLDREESVTESAVVHDSSQAVERALLAAPRFSRERPLPLRAGFPSPVSARIERGLDATRWVVEFRGGEMRLDGMEPRTGELVLDLEEVQPGLIRWRAVSDSSHMTHFLEWLEMVVRWQPLDPHNTRVTWTLRYRRGLDPAWYFGPMERYAVRLAAGYLIESVATP